MGFDSEYIIDINTCPMEYFCPVCCTLVYPQEALQSQCSHLYCKPCLLYVAKGSRTCPYDGYLVEESASKPLMESDKALAQNIGRVQVHCLYFRSGCMWDGTLSECSSHCLVCPFANSPVLCNRCGVLILHRQIYEHYPICPGECQTQQASKDAQPQVQFPPQVLPKIGASAQLLAPNHQGNPQQPLHPDMHPHTRIRPHTQQEVGLVQRKPVMQPFPFRAPDHIQLHQLGRIPLEKPLWPQVCPYPHGPPYIMQKNVEDPPESLPRQSQNYDGRHVMPVKCIQSQAFTQSSVMLGSMDQVRPMQLGLTQPYEGQSYSKSTVLEKIGDPVSEKFRAVQEVGSSSQKIVEKDSIRK